MSNTAPSCSSAGTPARDRRLECLRLARSPDGGLTVLSFLAALSLAQPPTVPDSPGAVESFRYFLLLFGSDAGPLRPARTHTWATYVKAEGRHVAEAVTISWLPADLVVNPLRPLRPEAGVNLTLADTLKWVREGGQRVTLFGPYEVDAARFVVAQTERELLDGGRVSYRAASSPAGMPPGLANCITAVGSVEPAVARRLPVRQFGRRGTAKAARDIEAGGAVKPADADWLLAALDVGPVDRSPKR